MSDDETQTQEAGADEDPKPAKKGKKPVAAVGGVSTPGKFERAGSNEADVVWNQLVDWLPSSNDPGLPTRSPWDVMIQVRRTHPPNPATGEPQPIGRGIHGAAVMGGPEQLPGDALINYVMRYYHLPTTDQPASYDLVFWKKTGGMITMGRLPMPSARECKQALAAREAADVQDARQQVVGAGMPPDRSWPQGPPLPPPPAPYQAPPPYGYPSPGYGAPSMGVGDPSGMMHMMSYLTGALQESLAAAREGRQPMIGPPPAPPMPVVAAPPPVVDEDRVVAKVLTALQLAGVLPGKGAPPAPAAPAAAVAAPPQVVQPPAPSPAPNDIGALVSRFSMGMTENLLKTAFGMVERDLRTRMGMGAPLAAEATVEEPEEPEKPEDMVPWKIAQVGAEWNDKRPVQVALSKETGDIDFMGTAFANPAVAERALDIAQGLGNSLQQFIRRFSEGAIGTATRSAPPGVGAPQAAPLPPPPPPPPQVPVPSTNAADEASPGGGGGWGAPPAP